MKAMTVVAMGLVTVLATPILANDRAVKADRLEAVLTGFEENPTLSTSGHGTFKASLNENDEIEYELTYADLESDITQSHVHFGRPAINGGIAVWLCGTASLPGPAGTAACVPGRSGTVTGFITAASIIGPAGQGIAAGEFQALVDAVKAGATYANVHSVNRPGGEIRGLVVVK